MQPKNVTVTLKMKGSYLLVADYCNKEDIACTYSQFDISAHTQCFPSLVYKRELFAPLNITNFGSDFSPSPLTSSIKYIKRIMNMIVFLAALAMLAMANAAPLQEQQKNNLQSLLDSLSDQTETRKEFKANVQQDDDYIDDNGSQAEAQFLHHIIKTFWANKQNDDQNQVNKQQYDDDSGSQAETQFLHHIVRALWANKQNDDQDQINEQQYDDYNGSQAETQFLGRLLKNTANMQQGDRDDIAEAQFWGSLGKVILKTALRHGVKYLRKRFG